MVASVIEVDWAGRLGLVSIPFIAGQWSLQVIGAADAALDASFQSPSLRGSGRFIEALARLRDHETKFQSPSLRGSGRFEALRLPNGIQGGKFQSPSLRGSGRFGCAILFILVIGLVSIPFIAGQWSLPMW